MTEIPNKIALFVADNEAKKFMLFQQYFEPFSLMLDKQVFEQRNAVVSLYFDNNSVLQTIQRKDYLFSRKFDVIPTFE